MPECPDCERDFIGTACPRCGWAAPVAPSATGPRRDVRRACPVDGAILQADGFCPAGGGYLAHMPCPFACPICRAILSWDGGCENCHGSMTGERETWTFPGDRYEFESAHWRKVATGPRPACSQAENAAGAKRLAAILGAAAVSGRAAAEADRAQGPSRLRVALRGA